MITVHVPATSANCSIGFDTLGLALDWRSSISFEPSSELKITGCPEDYAGEDNLVWTSYVHACKACDLTPPPVHIHIDSDIPFARGLGSSSQCVIAGLVGANIVASLGLDDRQLLSLAIEIEGHPDNAAPALLGGLNICVMEDHDLVRARQDDDHWKALVVIPPYEVSTPEARRALPETISLHDAAMQAGRAMLFEYAWTHHDELLLARSCHDVLHEPSRSRLIPDYDAMRTLAREMSTPFWISGSGSTMLFVSQDEHKLKLIQEKIEAAHDDLQVRLCRVSQKGAQVSYG